MSENEAAGARRSMPRADFVTGLAFAAVGLAALVVSLRMPRFAEQGVNPYTVPGLVPGLIGIVLTVLGLVLAVRAARAGGWRLGRGSGVEWAAEGGSGRLAVTLLLTIGYAGGLVGAVPFTIATGLFVLAFALLFTPVGHWRDRPRWRILGTAALLAVVTAVGVTVLFERLFLVRLP